MKEEKIGGPIVVEDAEVAAQNNGHVDTKALMAKRTRPVPTEIGNFIIRRLDHNEATEIDGSLADLSTIAAGPTEVDRAKGLRLPPGFNKRVPAIHRLVRAGVVEPKLFEKAEEGMTCNDIPFPIVMQLYREIMELAGATLTVAKRIRPS